MADEEITRRLDAIIAILKLAHSDSLTATRESLLRNEVIAAILDVTRDDFVPSGDIKAAVSKSTSAKDKTIQRRLTDLVAMGVLEKKPHARAAYRSTGVV
ncbi:MAG: hypothetical protein WEA29_06895 [Acidimicrobiia bacterium]